MSDNRQELYQKPLIVSAWTLCITFIVVWLVQAGFLVLAPRVYTSEAVVAFSADSTNSVAGHTSLPEQILTESRIIDSFELKTRVVQDLQLDAVWGKKYNNDKKLSLDETLNILGTRMGIYSLRNSQAINILVSGDGPVEPAEIANSIVWNYCNKFTKSRGITAKIVKSAESPAKIDHVPLILGIVKATFRSAIIALLAAGAGWGFAKARIHLPPPLPSEKRASSPFQKY